MALKESMGACVGMASAVGHTENLLSVLATARSTVACAASSKERGLNVEDQRLHALSAPFVRDRLKNAVPGLNLRPFLVAENSRTDSYTHLTLPTKA